MLIRLIEVEKTMRGGSPFLKEIYLNPDHIISIMDDARANQTLVQEATALGLDAEVRFSKITIQEGTVPRLITVVGTPGQIYKQLKKKAVLRG